MWVSGAQKNTRNKNQIRSHLKKYFQDLQCTTLVRPINEEPRLRNIEAENWSNLRQEFM